MKDKRMGEEYEVAYQVQCVTCYNPYEECLNTSEKS